MPMIAKRKDQLRLINLNEEKEEYNFISFSYIGILQ